MAFTNPKITMSVENSVGTVTPLLLKISVKSLLDETKAIMKAMTPPKKIINPQTYSLAVPGRSSKK